MISLSWFSVHTVISSRHFLYSYNPVLDICSWSFLGFPFPVSLLLESSALVPRLCSTSAPLLFSVFKTLKNVTPSSFLCKTLNNLFSSWEPSPICVHPFSLPFPTSASGISLAWPNTLNSFFLYLLPFLLQHPLPSYKGCELCVNLNHI